MTYLGKVVGRGQVCPVQSKVEAITLFPLPSSRRELRRFLGMAGYYRGFCHNFSAVAAPLTDLLSPKTKYAWTDSCQRAFQQVKALLTHAPVQAAPNFDVPFILLLTPVTLEWERFCFRMVQMECNIRCPTSLRS